MMQLYERVKSQLIPPQQAWKFSADQITYRMGLTVSTLKKISYASLLYILNPMSSGCSYEINYGIHVLKLYA